MINNTSDRTDCFKVFTSSPISYTFTASGDGTIKDVRASVKTQSVKTAPGECKVTAHALFTVISENDDGLYQEENLVTFDVGFKDDRISDNSPVRVTHAITDVKFAANGDDYLISAIIDSEADFFSFEPVSFRGEIEDAIVKTQQIDGLVKFSTFSEVSDFDGEKECSFEIKTMLCHDECVRITSCGASVNQVYAAGEIISEFLVTSRRGELIRETLVVPFRFESDCEDCLPENKVTVSADMVNAAYTVENDERRAVVSGVFTVNFTFNVFKNCSFTVVDDAFSQKCELSLVRDDILLTADVGTRELKYKCFGEASSDKGDDYVAGVTAFAVYAFDYNKDGDALNLSGVIKADLLVRNKEGTLRKAQAELPFTCAFDYDGAPVSVAVAITHFTAKDLDGKCVVECELLFDTQYYINKKYTVVVDATAGEPRKQDDSAVRIIFVKKGDDCWSVCKKACVSENDLLKQNPDLTFPAEKDSGIVIYNKM